MQPMQPMAPVPPAPPAKKVSAFGIGLVFGIILAVILIGIGLIKHFVAGAPLLGLVLSIISIVAALIAYFFAGFRASSQSGRVSTGLLAGMWTGLISMILNAIVAVLLSLSQLSQTTDAINQRLATSGSTTSMQFTDTTTLAFLIIGEIIVIIIVSAIALGVGAIGGAAGKGRAPTSGDQYQESLYQSPMGGYPPQPGYPSYPQQQPPQPGGYPGYPPQQPPGYPQQPPGYPPQQ